MPPELQPSPPASTRMRIIIAGAYLLYAAVVLRTLANPNLRARLPIYLGLELSFLLLFSLAFWRPARRSVWKHAYFSFESILVLTLIALRPQFDFVIILFILLAFQAQLLMPGRAGWIWVGILLLLTSIPLMLTLGALPGLSLTLMSMTIELVFAAYIAVVRELETGLVTTQVLLSKLQETNQQLRDSASQAEELSAIEERNRLARQLHDSVSQTLFSISLQTRATQILLEREPERLRPQLEHLRLLTQNALGEMRGLIAELRPPQAESARQPTP